MNGTQGCEYIADMLHDYGVTHVFNIEAMLRMTLRELEARGVRCIMPHSEFAAGYMADGYARASGRPGVCMAQSIGAVNLAAGLHDAFLACTPVIALTGKKPPMMQYKNAYQESDHRPAYESVTKFHAEITEPAQLPFLLRQSFREAVSGKPRPVHLDLCNHMGRWLETQEIPESPLAEPEYGHYPAQRPGAPWEAVQRAAQVLAGAERPLIVAGRGAAVSGAGDAILALARKASVPVVTSPDGKGLLDERDPLWGGIVGGYGMDCANRAAAEADLVLFIGTQASDQTTCDWRAPAPGTATIQIDLCAAELGKNYPGCIGLPGDASAVCAQLIEAVAPAQRAEWLAAVAGWRDATLAEYEQFVHRDSKGIRPERLCRELEQVLPDDAVLISDTGFSAVWTSTFLRTKATQDYYRAAGSLGWAFPAALGVKCAVGDRPVVCFCGDGGLYYYLSELETARRYGLNTVTVVNNNGVLAQCSQDIRGVFGVEEQRAEGHFRFTDVDLSELARAMGCHGVRVRDAAQIGPALREALACGKPALVEVLTEAVDAVPPALRAR